MGVIDLQDRADAAYKAWDAHRTGCPVCIDGRRAECETGRELYRVYREAHDRYMRADSMPEHEPGTLEYQRDRMAG